MEISVEISYGSTEIVFVAENVNARETISKTIYGIKEGGEKDYTQKLGDDIEDDYMEMFTRVLSEIMDYRKAEYDSSGLVKQLIEKLPPNIQASLIDELNEEYLES